MTIEIKGPELEALIEKKLRSGEFRNIEDLLTSALSKLPQERRFDPDVRRYAVRRMKEFSEESALSLGEPVTRELLHEEHRF